MRRLLLLVCLLLVACPSDDGPPDREYACSNGLDDDFDEFIDCEDQDCWDREICQGDDDDSAGGDDDDSGGDDDDSTPPGDDDDSAPPGDDDDSTPPGDDDDSTPPPTTWPVEICNDLKGLEDITAIWIRPTGGDWIPEVLQGQVVQWYGCANLNLPTGTIDVFIEDEAAFWYSRLAWPISGPDSWWVDYGDETTSPF